MHMSQQSRSAWTEQEDDMLRVAVARHGDRAWATVALEVPGRSSKSCSDRWRNFLSPEIEHPRKIPFSEWEVAVVVQAQHRYGNNWKAISMLLPGRTNRAVKNLFVGNLKWGARLPEIQNRYLETRTPLEDLLEVTPDYPGGPPKERPGLVALHASAGAKARNGAQAAGTAAGTGTGAGAVFAAPSASGASSAWASEATEQAFGPHSHCGAAGGFGPAVTTGLRRPHDAGGDASPTAAAAAPKRLRVDAEGHSPAAVECGAAPQAAAALPLAFGLDGMTVMTAAGGSGGVPAFMVPLMLAPDAAAAHLQPLFSAGLDAAHLGHLSQQQQPPCALLGDDVKPSVRQLQRALAADFAAPAAAGAAAPADAYAGAGSVGGGAALLLAGHPSNDSAMLAEIVGSILGDDDNEALAHHQHAGGILAAPLAGRSLGGSGGISSGGGLLLFGGDDCALLHGSSSGGSIGGGGAMARASTWPNIGSLGGAPWPASAGDAPGAAAAKAPSPPLALPPPQTPGAGAPAGQAPTHIPEAAFCHHPSRRVSTGDVYGASAAAAAAAPLLGCIKAEGGALMALPPTPQPGAFGRGALGIGA